VTGSAFVLSGAAAGNYNLIQPTGLSANITPATLTVTATGVNKVYDATTNASVIISDNVVSGDSVSVGYTANYLDPNVGNNKYIGVSGITITGANANDYTVNTSTAAFANISKASLVVSATGINKVYDAGTAATVTLTDNAQGADVLTLSYGTAAFGDKNVANGKTVNVGGINVTGAEIGNYTFNTTAVTTANIAPLAITVAATGVNKVYDASLNDAATLASAGVIGGDTVAFSGTSATFADKNVANGKTVSVAGITASGTDAGNYTFNTTALTTANITPLAITVAATGVNKVYDAADGNAVNIPQPVGSDGSRNLFDLTGLVGPGSGPRK
jgi:hypothetical protein